MIVLSMDTTGKSVGCAVVKDGVVTSSVYRNCGLTHSETLMPAVDEVLTASGLSQRDVDLIACVTGPGSFTGVRIGVCAARGMAHALGIPCYAVDALQTIAENLPYAGIVCPMLDARRNQVYAATFDTVSGEAVRVMEDEAVALSDFLEKLPEEGKILFSGDGSRVYRSEIEKELGDRALFAPENCLWPRADAAALIAYRNRETCISPEELMPLYLRAPQAERERAERNRNNG